MSNVIMPSIKKLLRSLRENDWYITAFDFNYNNQEYVVIMEDLKELGKGSKYYAVMFTFIDIHNEMRTLETYANSYNSNLEEAILLDYFGVEGMGNNQGAVWSLYTAFNHAMPDEYNELPKLPIRFCDVVVNRIDERDGHEGFCFSC